MSSPQQSADCGRLGSGLSCIFPHWSIILRGHIKFQRKARKKPQFSDLCGERSWINMAAAKNLEIDQIDRRIIGILTSHGRLSFRDLGAQVHLSPNATADRVRRLQSANIICGFHAEIDRTKLGLSLQAYIDVRLRPGTSAQSFEAVATKLPGIINAAILTGALDFRLRVACQGQSDLVQLIETLRSRAGVQETNTTVILKELAANTYVRSI